MEKYLNKGFGMKLLAIFLVYLVLLNLLVPHNIFSMLKMQGINAELVQEFVKDKVYEESVEVFKNPSIYFGKQYFRISRLQIRLML